MEEPSRRTSRLSIAAAMIVLFAAGVVGFLLGQSTIDPTPSAAPVKSSTPAPKPSSKAMVPAVQPPLGRGDLIAAAARAADASAAGRVPQGALQELVGRGFELRLPFGCPGAPQLGAGAFTVEYDEKAGALRVRAEPVRWSPEEWLPQGDADEGARGAEGIEGFWVGRPWTSDESCPASDPASAEPQPPLPAEQTLGIAQVFAEQGSRVGRRDGKAYELVQRVKPEAMDLTSGLRLRLRGKVSEGGGAGPVVCRAAGGSRPVCLILVTFDTVAVEHPSDEATLATWDMSTPSRSGAER